MPVPPPPDEALEAQNGRLRAEAAEPRALVEAQADRIAGLESQLEDLRARQDQDFRQLVGSAFSGPYRPS